MLSGPRRAYVAWDHFWFREGCPDGLCAFRALYGFYWIIAWLSLLPHVTLYLSADGMFFPAFDPPPGVIHNVYEWVGSVTAHPSVARAWLLYVSTFAAIVCIALGLFTRTALLLFLASYAYHYYLYYHMFGTSYHRILMLCGGMLFLGPCGASLSLDAVRAKRRGDDPPKTVPLWTQQLLCVQIALVYFGTGVHKVISPAWETGENMMTSMIGDFATPLGFFVASHTWQLPGFYDFMTNVLVVFEVSAGFLLFHKKWQKLVFVVGAAFHIGNSTLLWIPPFLVMIASYVLFLEPETVGRVARRMARRLGAVTARTASCS